MKIGLYGGIANNMYVVAKALAEAGHEVMFVRDTCDSYPFSQPVWEDIQITLPYEEVVVGTRFNMEYWLKKEEQLGWSAPSFMKTQMLNQVWESAPRKGIFSRSARALARMKMSHLKGSKELLMQNDVLVVCGIDGAILASKTNLPYIIWPHGGDIRLAAGMVDLPKGWCSRLLSFFQHRQLNTAFRRADYVGSHDPKGIGGHIGDMSPYLKNLKFGWMPIPIRKRTRPERVERLSRLRSALSTILDNQISCAITSDNLICFIPSRFDFFWKGQDILLRSLAYKNYPVRLIFSGWGKDYHKGLSMIKELQLEEHVIFLPSAVSKPLLFQLYDSVDLVCDQFQLGTYGTAAVEAMASGTPVMMSIDEAAWRVRDWIPPPVINVRTEEEIEKAFSDIIYGQLNLDCCSNSIKQWFDKTHSCERFIQFTEPLFNRVIKAHRK